MIHPRLCNAKPNFYPRSPCGERLRLYWLSLITLPISIHALLAESDVIFLKRDTPLTISIHALLAESDARLASRVRGYSISIHALLAESDAPRAAPWG